MSPGHNNLLLSPHVFCAVRETSSVMHDLRVVLEQLSVVRTIDSMEALAVIYLRIGMLAVSTARTAMMVSVWTECVSLYVT